MRRMSETLGLLILLTICLSTRPSKAQYGGGTGEPNDPYQVRTPEEFISIAYRREDWAKHFILMSDLDFSGTDSNEVIPIGDDIAEFSGIFDGAGHTISNFTCQLEGLHNVGVFGILVAPTPDPDGVIAIVKNLHLVNAEIRGGIKVGGLVGWNRGTVTGCSVDGNVVGLSTVGGLVGINQGEINMSCSEATVTSQQDIAGGLVGDNSPILSNIVGPLLTGNGWAGISKSFSSAKVTGEKNVGGLVGSDNGTVSDCYSSGSVTGRDTVGGLIGDSRGREMKFCYSTANVTGDLNTGGLIGSRPYHMEDQPFCIWDTDICGMRMSAAGRGKTTEEMMSSKTYYCWGVNDNWTIDEGNDYPHLTWENRDGHPISKYDRLYGGGSGDANDPYLISTPQQLITVGWYEEDYDKHFLLMTNLDFNDISSTEILPIGSAKVAFTGVFDGQGHTISRIKLRSYRNVGVFGVVGSRIPDGLLRTPYISEFVDAQGFVRNLQVTDANLTGSYMLGILVGFNVNGTISGCSVTGSVGAEGAGNDVLGGLVGRNMGLIEKCTASCYVNGGSVVGGLVGSNYGTIQFSYSTGEVIGLALYTGGLSGDNTGNISNCHSQCLVQGVRRVGGLVGSNSNEIINCYNTGDISGQEHIGGLVGVNTGYVNDSYSTSSVSGDVNVGGLVGCNGFSWKTGSPYPGRITNCYSTGNVSGTSSIGGLVGLHILGTVTSCFWDIETSGQATSAEGMGLTTAKMQDVSTYLNAGWDFVDEILNGTCDYWQISPYNYPKLRYNMSNSPAMPDGVGTTQQPYLIQNARDLGTVWFESSAYYRLEASIDLSGITWSTPVIPSFGGTFDGNGYTISHLTVIGHRYLGLFGRLRDGAEIKNLGVVDVNITGSDSNVASLAGSNKGSITACYSTGTITGEPGVGGLVGENNGAITASYSTCTVTGRWGIGGLASENNGAITASYSTGTATGDKLVGGLIGHNKGEVNDCYSTSTVNGNYSVGGLVGAGGWGITASFWDTQTSGQNKSSGGTGKTTAKMQMASTFLEAGWDFMDETTNGTKNIWWIDEGKDYPRLFWELIEDNQ